MNLKTLKKINFAKSVKYKIKFFTTQKKWAQTQKTKFLKNKFIQVKNLQIYIKSQENRRLKYKQFKIKNGSQVVRSLQQNHIKLTLKLKNNLYLG